MKASMLKFVFGMFVMAAMVLPTWAEEDAAAMVEFFKVPFGATIIYEVDGETVEELLVVGKKYPANSRIIFKTRGTLTMAVDGREGQTTILGDRFAAIDLSGTSVLGGVKVTPIAGNVKIVSGDGASEEILSAKNEGGTTGDSQQGNPIRRSPGIPVITEQSAPVFIPAPNVTPPGPQDPPSTPPTY